jgi:hypothetical protein
VNTISVETHPQVEVDLDPIRRAFLESGRSACDVARDLGWLKADGTPDANRVTRRLGLATYHPGHGYPPCRQQRCSAETAVAFARAIGVEPVMLGV